MVKTTVNLRELQELTNRLFEHIIKDQGVETVELLEDFYWKVPTRELYNLKQNPAMLEVGSLYDQWGSLKRLKDTDGNAYKLIEAASLLRYIAEVVSRRRK